MFEETPDELTEIDGIGPKNLFGLKLAQAVSMSYLKDRIQSKDFLTSSDEVLDYLKANLRERSREVFMVLFLNGRNQILSIEELFEGTLTTSAVYPREVVDRTLKNKQPLLYLFTITRPGIHNRQKMIWSLQKS